MDTNKPPEAAGIVEFGKLTELADGVFVLVEPVRSPHKVYVRVTSKRKPTGKVRHRRPIRKTLTDPRPEG